MSDVQYDGHQIHELDSELAARRSLRLETSRIVIVGAKHMIGFDDTTGEFSRSLRS